jgi:hypothetical protein
MKTYMNPQDGVLQALATFASRTRFEDLPDNVVHETRRMLLDCVGVAFAAQSVAKGRMCTQLSQQLGGGTEATILGARGKVSACNAALANGELINALDFDALFIPGGHVAPYVVPAILAMAEARDASGRDLILALAIGTEIAMRVTRGMSPMVQTLGNDDGSQSYRWTEPYGGSRYNLGAGGRCRVPAGARVRSHVARARIVRPPHAGADAREALLHASASDVEVRHSWLAIHRRDRVGAARAGRLRRRYDTLRRPRAASGVFPARKPGRRRRCCMASETSGPCSSSSTSPIPAAGSFTPASTSSSP